MDRDIITLSGHGLHIMYANGTGLEFADMAGGNIKDKLI